MAKDSHTSKGKDSSKDESQNLDALIHEFAAPRYNVYYPTDVWNEVLPGLFLGGTPSEDDLATVLPGQSFGMPEPSITKDDFVTVVTLYAWARPADWFVKEIRLGILDGTMSDFNLDDIRSIVLTAHSDWKAGKRVLIRCQAGINRSSLIMALVLIRDGMSAKAAIDIMRSTRGAAVLANSHFVDWLTQLDVRKWRD